MSRGALPEIIEIEADEGRRTIVTPSLRLTFDWDGDRWSHRLEVVTAAAVFCLARSIEAGPGEDDSAHIASPVYQHLAFQRGASGVQALLVGQAGARHDSAAFTVREQADGVIVEADVASRCRSSEPAPCCAYVVAASPGDLRDAGPDRIVWELDGPAAGRLVFESATAPDPPARVTLAESGRRATHVQADAIAVAGAATRRLGYRWRWTVSPHQAGPQRTPDASHSLLPNPANAEEDRWIS